VEYLKHGEAKDFAIVDAAMNDLMRPALYDAWHDILPVCSAESRVELVEPIEPRQYAVVGPVCETGDFIGHDRSLALVEGDLLLICSAGAYGMSMSSNYNSRPRAAEVMVAGAVPRLIHARERIADLFAHETT
jgi:diaminopimelate decarboxylase